jgi:hypothetical protein
MKFRTNVNQMGNFTQDVLNTLTLTDGKAYIGFSGGCGASYATQRITGWTFKSSARKSLY